MIQGLKESWKNKRKSECEALDKLLVQGFRSLKIEKAFYGLKGCSGLLRMRLSESLGRLGSGAFGSFLSESFDMQKIRRKGSVIRVLKEF